MSNDSLTSTATQSRTAAPSRSLPVITLVVAGAAAVLSIIAITTNDAAAPTTVAVQQAAPGSAVAPAPITAVHHRVDGCGMPIVGGHDTCW